MEDKRARLLGGRMERKRIRAKAKSVRGRAILAGVFERRIPLKGWHKDHEYAASLRRDGRVSDGGALYESASAAGRAARRLPTSG